MAQKADDGPLVDRRLAEVLGGPADDELGTGESRRRREDLARVAHRHLEAEWTSGGRKRRRELHGSHDDHARGRHPLVDEETRAGVRAIAGLREGHTSRPARCDLPKRRHGGILGVEQREMDAHCAPAAEPRLERELGLRSRLRDAELDHARPAVGEHPVGDVEDGPLDASAGDAADRGPTVPRHRGSERARSRAVDPDDGRDRERLPLPQPGEQAIGDLEHDAIVPRPHDGRVTELFRPEPGAAQETCPPSAPPRLTLVTSPNAADRVAALMRTIPDFPEPGIQFMDLTPVFADGPALATVAAGLAQPFDGSFDVVAGVEARGFALAAAVAARTGHGLLLVRKAGKLPGERLAESYELEYGTATLEVHVDQVPAGSRILVVDDVLATGGTLRAAESLIRRAGWTIAGLAVVLELAALGGREALAPQPIHALLTL